MRTALLLLLAALVAPAPAHGNRYPVPPEAQVFHTGCPGHPQYVGCTSGFTIWLHPAATRFDTSHEYGHVRYNALPPLWQAGLLALFAGYQNPIEIAADAYASCDLGLVPRTSGRTWVASYGYDPTRRFHRHVCAVYDGLYRPFAR